MKISIITANYNKEQFLLETALSIINQTFSNWEWFIVDDASTDNSIEVLKDLQHKDERIKVQLNTINKGANTCRNQGLHLTKGEYIIFLDADDLLSPFCLEQRINQIKLQNQYDLWVFSMGVFKNKIGDKEGGEWIPPKEDADFLKLFLSHQLPWSICQPIWRKDFLIKIKGFNEVYVRLQDVELHTRALLNDVRVKTFSDLKPDCYYRVDEKRTDLNNYHFLNNFIKGSLQYYSDFFNQVSKKQQTILVGTILEPLSLICFHKRRENISKHEANILSDMLLDNCKIVYQKRILRFYFLLNSFLPFHPKGLKKVISILL